MRIASSQSDDPAAQSYPPGSVSIVDRRKEEGKLRTGETSRSIGLPFVVPTLLGYVEPLKKGYHLRTKGTSNFFLYAR